MPLFFQQDIDVDTRLAIWKIEEPEDFFSQWVPLPQTITHPHKRLQHLAGRWLLRHLFADFPLELIQIADTQKPFLDNEEYHFSISHCGMYAAAIVSKKRRVGIDIELNSEKLIKLSHKFISESEALLYIPPVVVWSSKEAVFKWYGKGGLDFKKHMTLTEINYEFAGFNLKMLFQKEEVQKLHLHGKAFDDLWLVHLTT